MAPSVGWPETSTPLIISGRLRACARACVCVSLCVGDMYVNVCLCVSCVCVCVCVCAEGRVCARAGVCVFVSLIFQIHTVALPLCVLKRVYVRVPLLARSSDHQALLVT